MDNNNFNNSQNSGFENNAPLNNQPNVDYQGNNNNMANSQFVDNQTNTGGQSGYIAPQVINNQSNMYNQQNLDNQYSFNNQLNNNPQFVNTQMNNAQPNNMSQQQFDNQVNNVLQDNHNQPNNGNQIINNIPGIKKYMGLIGCVLVVLGCFLPFAGALGAKVSYISGDGKIVLVAIIVSGILIYLKKNKLSLIPSGIGGLIFMFDAMKVLGASGVGIGFGLILMFIGFVITIAFPLLENKINLN